MALIGDYFYKESASFPYLWQKRFFQLFEEDTGNYILYRARESDGKPKGRIPIARILDVIPYTTKSTEQRFKIIIPNRTYYLKAMSVDMRMRWEKAIKASIKKMEDGKAKMESKMVQSIEDLGTLTSMQEYLAQINHGMRFLNGILSSNEAYGKLAVHMGMEGYFSIASYAPDFFKLYREIYNGANFKVEVSLENTSSSELPKERFEKFLMIVEQKPLISTLKAVTLEKKISDIAVEVVKKSAKFRKEAMSVLDKANEDDDKDAVQVADETVKGIDLIIEFFKMLQK
mmetsp:Transcript_24818/g.34532  ORF Transcript_24818/g.34532 Transcript_24818/m.34532 type:complete len:287 (+) Transcript_24818:58-918(+)